MTKIETDLIQRLGPLPFWRGRQKCTDAFRRMYKTAGENAARILAKNGSEESNKDNKKGIRK